MPQLSGDDLGANDELIPFKDEGEQEEKRSVSAHRDLDDVKSSLVNESETISSSDSETDRRPKPRPDLENRARHSQLFEEALRRQQDAGLFQPSPYMGYPFFMIPDLGNLCNPYLTNGALASSAQMYLPFQWPVLDVPGRSAAVRDAASPAQLSNSVPVVQRPPHMSHLHPLLSYSPEAFSPQRASPGFSPDAGVSRTLPNPCYPMSPGGMTQIPHPLGWLQGQSMYPIAGGFSPVALSSLMSGGFSPRLVPTPQSSIPHPAIVSTVVKQEPGGGCSSSQRENVKCDAAQEKEDDKRNYVKKPLNAFMLYMREERPKVVAQCKVKESATINQILGQRWHSLSKDDQSKYYDLARKERLLHSKLYPGWSARENYGKKKKRKRTKSETEQMADDLSPQLKRPCVSTAADETPHTHSHTHPHTPLAHPPPQTAHAHSRPHTVSHLTHTHLSQASPASSLDSPATPTTSLASPGAPAPTHTDHAHSSFSYSGHMSPYGEQLQPLPLTTKPHRPTHPLNHRAATITPGPSTPSSSSSDTPALSPLTAACRSPLPPPLLSQPFLAPPPTSTHQSAASSHGALAQLLRRAHQP
ncbi:transcription factor 7-like 1-B isoform X2 [Solea solea]|uniref:transcription factor 7-like 1-B isoform X2 n=1 Tax=Solea solea TaxID=90069 RepID=UPI00272C33C6|nr:transcription factor 7-like 1-B isoform X2 [Solea solea]